MVASDLFESHVNHFIRALQTLNHGSEIDLDYIQSVLKDSTFPQPGRSAAFTATAGDIHVLVPYQALVALVASPNHLSEHTNILEYKIIDWARSTQEQQYFPFHFSVFPDGRIILGISGLILDSEGEYTEYEINSLLEDKFKVDSPRVLTIFKQAIESFPAGDLHLETVRKAALSDLATSLGTGSTEVH